VFNNNGDWRVAVVVPAYRVKEHILQVLGAIPDIVTHIFVVDDACPDKSGEFVAENISDARVSVVYLDKNQGVGGAVMAGYAAAMAKDVDVIVKVDGDGQMDPSLIPAFITPILQGEADYTKGNRFNDLEAVKGMPLARIIGNAGLSFLNKLSSGYWNIFDPTNGYTAIHSAVCKKLPLNKISNRYFFESDMLFRLNTLHAVVIDIPMEAKYATEKSNLKISKVFGEFFLKHNINFIKRIFYNYFLRDLSLASIQLLFGFILMIFGVSYGGYHWYASAQLHVPTPAGTVMVAAMPVLVGLQFILSFIGYDIASVPKRPLQRSYVQKRLGN
jgi:dolichol-phosphate mannosyltransferase